MDLCILDHPFQKLTFMMTLSRASTLFAGIQFCRTMMLYDLDSHDLFNKRCSIHKDMTDEIWSFHALIVQETTFETTTLITSQGLMRKRNCNAIRCWEK